MVSVAVYVVVLFVCFLIQEKRSSPSASSTGLGPAQSLLSSWTFCITLVQVSASCTPSTTCSCLKFYFEKQLQHNYPQNKVTANKIKIKAIRHCHWSFRLSRKL